MLKKLSVITLTAAALLVLSCGTKPSNGIWYSFNDGFRKSITENKIMMIDFFSETCQYCKVMDYESFSDDGILRILDESYVPVRVDVGDMNAEPVIIAGEYMRPFQLGEYLGVKGLPSLAFIDSNGKFLTMLPGYIPAETLKGMLGYIADGCLSSKVPLEDYLNGSASCSNKKDI